MRFVNASSLLDSEGGNVPLQWRREGDESVVAAAAAADASDNEGEEVLGGEDAEGGDGGHVLAPGDMVVRLQDIVTPVSPLTCCPL